MRGLKLYIYYISHFQAKHFFVLFCFYQRSNRSYITEQEVVTKPGFNPHLFYQWIGQSHYSCTVQSRPGDLQATLDDVQTERKSHKNKCAKLKNCLAPGHSCEDHIRLSQMKMPTGVGVGGFMGRIRTHMLYLNQLKKSSLQISLIIFRKLKSL